LSRSSKSSFLISSVRESDGTVMFSSIGDLQKQKPALA
jgi:hypothetical protein